MVRARTEGLVSTDWLADHLTAPDVRIVDATWYHPKLARDARAEWAGAHLPGAVFFDIDEIAADGTDLPHMLPPPEKFASKVRKMGLGDGHRIVVYDRAGGAGAAARVWWMFRVFGHSDVSVLDGGFVKWVGEGRPVEDIAPVMRERHFTSRMDSTLVRSVEQMKANAGSRREQVIDARSASRFRGLEPEPWPGIKVGHIPGSVNLPFPELLDANSTFKPASQLKAAFEQAGLDLAKPIVATCGSGVTAAVLALGLYEAGVPDVAVYDGSWAEWGNREDTPVER